MNNQEAKFILRAYRSNGVDANDAVFAEALQQAQQDPTLKAWLASQQAMDAVMAAKLKEIIPPAGLREAILTGAKVSSSQPSFWRQTRWISLGAAAALLIVTSIAVWPKRASAENALLTEFRIEGHRKRGARPPWRRRQRRSSDVGRSCTAPRCRNPVGFRRDERKRLSYGSAGWA